jgi:hypothetical protein
MHVSWSQSALGSQGLLLTRSFTSYTAGVMIAYGASQKALHGLAFSDDIELIGKCISLLSYCALEDAVAGRFRDLLNRQLGNLQRLPIPDRNSPEENPAGQPTFSDILFDFDSGPSQLRSTARNLLGLIHRPFSGLGEVSIEATLSNRTETTMGTHLEWEWELKNHKNTGDLMDLESSNVTSGETDSTGKSPLLQPLGAAWTTWTPTKRA